jgi:hypothetical protein
MYEMVGNGKVNYRQTFTYGTRCSCQSVYKLCSGRRVRGSPNVCEWIEAWVTMHFVFEDIGGSVGQCTVPESNFDKIMNHIHPGLGWEKM